MLTAIVSGKAAPGVTTATWALALAWPRPVLVVDADPAGGDMAPGMLAGRVQADRGVLSWATATRRMRAHDAAVALDDHVVGLPEAEHVSLMPGLQNATQSAALDAHTWSWLAHALHLDGREVLMDVGRLQTGSCWPGIATAGRVLLATGRSVRSIHAARNAAAMLQAQLGDLDRVSLVVIGSGPYDAVGIARELGVPLFGQLPEDRAAAMVLSDGAPAGIRGIHRTKLLIAARGLAHELAEGVPARAWAEMSP
jgi:MinD-like ATPase involved in chromosome partitioning or flagellar assembly